MMKGSASSITLGMCGLINMMFNLYILLPTTAALFWSQNTEKSYDFIVVGSGSSGAVVASRLSEVANVLLLESGGDETVVSRIPLITTTLQVTNMNWHYKSEPQQQACLGLKEKRSNLPSGNSLGGSSAINGMLYVRGNPYDFDNWESLGNYGWNWTAVLRFFLKAENNLSPSMANNTNHGKGGPLDVSDTPFFTNLRAGFFEAVESMGYPVGDINGEIQSGAMIPQVTMLRGKRFSTNQAYLKPVSNRPSLNVKTYARVLRIIFDQDKRATGVVYEQNGIEYIANATKEIILSAGAIGTPKLLLLSGIGPKEHLDQFNIPTIQNLPGVGQNFHDHVWSTGCVYTVETNDPITLANTVEPLNLIDYLLYGKGTLSSPSGIESEAWLNTKYANQSIDWPDIYVMFVALSPLTDFGLTTRYLFNFNDEIWTKYFAPYLGKNSFSMYPTLAHPKSRGFVKLQSANPYDAPIIDPMYLTNQDDVNTMVQALKLSARIGAYKAFEKFGTKLIQKVVPGCEGFTQFSDEYWTCFARQMTSSAYHYVGSAKMGNDTDSMAVVDPELRVYGVKGLRVSDCSIMPEIVTGNPSAVAVMIGEKASDMIKKTYNYE